MPGTRHWCWALSRTAGAGFRSASRLLVAALAIVVLINGNAPVVRAQPVAVNIEPARISLSVKEMAIADVLKLIADTSGLSIAIGQEVKGTVTLYVEERPVADVLRLAVEMVNASIADEGGVYRVMSTASFESTYGYPYQSVMQKVYIGLQNVTPQEIMPSATALRTAAGKIIPDERANGLWVVDAPAGAEAIQRLVESMDTSLETREYEARSLEPQTLAARIREHLPVGTQIEVDSATRRLLITGPQVVLGRADRITSLLDRMSKVVVRPYELSYVEPDTVASALRSLLTADVGRVLVDRRSKQVLVTDFEEQQQLVQERIRVLDKPTRQVLIEAKIIQVSINDEKKVGIDWEVMQEKLNSMNVSVRLPVLSNTEDGMRVSVGDLESDNYNAVVQALQTFGDTELLSSPRVMVQDGRTAQIHVGSQVPYKTIDTREGPSGVIDRFERVVIVPTGVQLEVGARIHRDDVVTMDVRPEVSAVVAFSDGIPIVETSEASSTVSILSGRTVILGGLNRTESRSTRKGVPILSSIPFVKYLFSSKVEKEVRTEIAILLSPTIVSGHEDSDHWSLGGDEVSPAPKDSQDLSKVR